MLQENNTTAADIPSGFKLGVAAADFRNKGNKRLDLALCLSTRPAAAAGVFTTNLYKAAPVLAAMNAIADGSEEHPWAVVVNTGQANACTGQAGMDDCLDSLRIIGQAAGINPAYVLPGSTGVIGARMDLAKWRKAAPVLAASLGQASLLDFATAIMTTDAFPKLSAREVGLTGGTAHLAGVAKGAGMICPNMATMLSLVLCDAKVNKSDWQAMFDRAVQTTFNRVSVDGDTSTNDALIGLANGASGLAPQGSDLDRLEEALTEILAELSYLLVKDGEGATKVIRITVSGAATDQDAERIARTVGHSQLVKTAMFGRDPNWGRIVAAAGRSGVRFNPDDLRVNLCGVELFRHGQPTGLDFDSLLKEPLSKTDLELELSLTAGKGHYRLLASDLSHDYVNINSDYRS